MEIILIPFFIFGSLIAAGAYFMYFKNPKIVIEGRVLEKYIEKWSGMSASAKGITYYVVVRTPNFETSTFQTPSQKLYDSINESDEGIFETRGMFLTKFTKN
jgi:hypothetical protein